MDVIIIHPDAEVIKQVDELTRNEPTISTLCTDYAELHRSGLAHDAAVVSPGNGFGILDGGFDAALRDAHGPELERRIKRIIIDQYGVELPVGTAIFVRTPDDQGIIYAPTMQGPVEIVGTDHAYLATRAAVHRARYHGFDAIYMPLMGAGAGALPVAEAVDQIVCGVHDGMMELTPGDITWAHADRMHLQWHRMCSVPDDNYRWADMTKGVHGDDAMGDTP